MEEEKEQGIIVLDFRQGNFEALERECPTNHGAITSRQYYRQSRPLELSNSPETLYLNLGQGGTSETLHRKSLTAPITSG